MSFALAASTADILSGVIVPVKLPIAEAEGYGASHIDIAASG